MFDLEQLHQDYLMASGLQFCPGDKVQVRSDVSVVKQVLYVVNILLKNQNINSGVVYSSHYFLQHFLTVSDSIVCLIKSQ